MLKRVFALFLVPLTLIVAPLAFGAEAGHDRLDLTSSWVGLASILTFVAAYALVIGVYPPAKIQAGNLSGRDNLGDDRVRLRTTRL